MTMSLMKTSSYKMLFISSYFVTVELTHFVLCFCNTEPALAASTIPTGVATAYCTFVVCFGGVYNKKFDKKFITKFSKLVPMDRMCKIEEILPPINFLLDHKNSYMTGHSLVIDGGRTIW